MNWVSRMVQGLRFCGLIGLSFFLIPVETTAQSRNAPVPPSYLQAYKEDYFPVSQVKPGMKGYGLTVFKGTKIERFEVDVLGVIEGANAGRPLILIKMSGGPITERGTNIIGGMSGSPVFIQGKILGAVAYGYGFPKEPHGLVTPLEDMLETLDAKLPEPQVAISNHTIYTEDRTVSLKTPIRIQNRAFRHLHLGLNPPSAGTKSTLWARPLLTPLAVSGLSQKGVQKLEEILQPYGLKPIMAPGGVSKPVQAALTPGAAVAGSLAIGDVDLTAIGTLTYRKGNRVLMFGHPFLSAGAIEMPMSMATILDVFPAYDASVKFGNRAQIVGAITQDRAFAVAGTVGAKARLMPVSMRVVDETTGRSGDFKCEIVNHPTLAPLIVNLIASDLMGRVRYGMGETTLQTRWRLETDKLGEIEYSNFVSTIGDPAQAAMQEMIIFMMQLQSNNFEPVRLKQISIEIKMRSGRQMATIDRIFTRESSYKPGDEVKVGVVLKPYNGEPETRYMTIQLPKNLPNGRYMLQARGGAMPVMPPGMSPELAAMLFGGSAPTAPPANLQQMVKQLQERDKNSDLTLRLFLSGSAVTIEGEKLPMLPPVMRDILIAPRSSSVRVEREEIKQVESLPWQVSGMQVLGITVQRPDMSDRPASRPEGGTGAPPFGSPPSEGFGPPGGLYTGDEEEEFLSGKRAFSTGWMQDSGFQRIPSPESTRGLGTSDSEEGEGKSDVEESRPSERTGGQEKPVSRQAKRWQPSTYEVLSKGISRGVTVTLDGTIKRFSQLKRLTQVPSGYVWSLAAGAQGRYYAGTGNSGKVYRLNEEGKAFEIAKLPAVAVSALVVAPDGTLYAAAVPSGTIYKITEGQAPLKMWDTGSRYVNRMIWHNNHLIAATGAPARVLAFSPDGMQELMRTDESNITALTAGADGALYVGVSESGGVFRLHQGRVELIHDCSEPCISALAADEKGFVYIGTHPRGNIYRWSPEGEARALHPKGGLSTRAMLMEGGQLFIFTANTLYQMPLGTQELPTLQGMGYDEAIDITTAVRANGVLLIGTANNGEIFTTAPAGDSTYESPIHDAKQRANWGYIRWSAQEPEGSSAQIQTRSGNSPYPDETWSAWSSAYSDPLGSRISSPSARYIQFRVMMKGGSTEAEVSARNLSISYMPKNQPPKLTLQEPKVAAVWSGEKTARWNATDPDGDSLIYESFLSGDGGKTWERVKSKLAKTESSGKEEAEADEPEMEVPSPEEMRAQLQEALDSSPDMPADVRAQIEQNMDQNIEDMRTTMQNYIDQRREARAASGESASSGRATSLSIDTSQYPDGTYLLKVTASDKPSMPTDFATVEAVSAPITICNTPPALIVNRETPVDKEKRATIEGYAFQMFTPADKKNGEMGKGSWRNDVPITAIQYRVGNSKDWNSAEPGDGFFDSGYEWFRIQTEPLTPGEVALEIKVFNAAGKSTTKQVKIKVEK